MYPKISPPKIQTVAQKRPANLAVGTVLYRAIADYDEDSDKTSVHLNEWHVTSIKRKLAEDLSPTVYMVRKIDGLTWGKLSTRSGDYGWLPSIPTHCRNSFILAEYMGTGFGTTPEKAYALAVGITKHSNDRYALWDKEPGSLGFSENIKAGLREMEALERRRKSCSTKRKNARNSSALKRPAAKAKSPTPQSPEVLS